MNIKDAYHYQNYLQDLLTATRVYLATQSNVTCLKQEHLKSASNPEAKDEVIENANSRALPYTNNQIIDFMLSVMDERRRVTEAIATAKRYINPDPDTESAVNKCRREIMETLRHLYEIKPSERKSVGHDFKLNANGEQVSYAYNIREVCTIDFDRNKVRRIINELAAKADSVSSSIDRSMLEEIDFCPLFNVNETLEDAIETQLMLEAERANVEYPKKL